MKKRRLSLILWAASFRLFTIYAAAADFYVSTSIELQNALIAAASTAEPDTIHLAQGTYNGSFSYSSSLGYDIAILGGYNWNFSQRQLDPTNTTLDGASGLSNILSVVNNNGGTITIEGLTIQNTTMGWGVYATTNNYSGTAGDITIRRNIISNNTGFSGGGLFLESVSTLSVSGTITVSHNIISQNGTSLEGGGLYAMSYYDGETVIYNNIITDNSTLNVGGGILVGGDNVLVVNNTITGNTAPSNSGGGLFGVVNDNVIDVYNNIIRGNSGGDIWFQTISSGTRNGYNNDYHSLGGSGWSHWGDNIDADPKFLGGGDYRLQTSSPCIDAGSNIAPVIPEFDMDIDFRIIDGTDDGFVTIDMGAYEYGNWLMSTHLVLHGHDFTGDELSDIAVYRPADDPQSSSIWWIKGNSKITWGSMGDIPVSGDYNGDGTTDIAVFRPSTGRWWIKNQNAILFWGQPGDIPVPGDYVGDDKTDIAVWRPSTGRWWIKGQSSAVYFGRAGDLPVPADYNGDGKTDIAVWRPSTGRWWINGSSSVIWGKVRDIPVPADYDGDGNCDIAVWDKDDGKWWLKGIGYREWGESGDIPVPGNYTDVKNPAVDIRIWRPSTGEWLIIGNSTGPVWGMVGYIPLVR